MKKLRGGSNFLSRYVRSSINFLLACFVILIASCHDASSPATANAPLRIAVAANMQYAIKPLVQAFSEKTGYKVDLIIGSSGKLTAQILQGAPFHVFLSADMKYPNALAAAGKTHQEPQVYAYGKLILLSKNTTLDVQKALSVLTTNTIQTIAIANPANAPYGQQAQALLQRKLPWDTVKSKMVYGESIAQTNQFIQTGAADIGITSQSILKSLESPNDYVFLELNEGYEFIAQGAVITSYGFESLSQKSQAFMTFLGNPISQAILSDFGYQLPE